MSDQLRKFTWESGDVDWETTPAPGAPPIMTPEQRAEARRQLDEMRATRDAGKQRQDDVGFEHPARGPHHCSECAHFEGPTACEIVAGRVEPVDWCVRFLLDQLTGGLPTRDRKVYLGRDRTGWRR